MTDALERAIREYQGEALPPARLEPLIRARLVREGALSRRRAAPLRRLAWPMLAAAAAVAILAAVLFDRAPAPGEAGARRTYALVLDTVTQNYGEMDPEQAALLAERYTAWIDRIRSSGRLVDALYLKQPDSERAIDQVSGIVVVRTRSLEEVERIVADSPHTARGGTISIREVLVDERH